MAPTQKPVALYEFHGCLDINSFIIYVLCQYFLMPQAAFPFCCFFRYKEDISLIRFQLFIFVLLYIYTLSFSPFLCRPNLLCRPPWTRTQRFICLCLPTAGIKGILHHTSYDKGFLQSNYVLVSLAHFPLAQKALVFSLTLSCSVIQGLSQN